MSRPDITTARLTITPVGNGTVWITADGHGLASLSALDDATAHALADRIAACLRLWEGKPTEAIWEAVRLCEWDG